jgi:AcrR family transcriptional regulator
MPQTTGASQQREQASRLGGSAEAVSRSKSSSSSSARRDGEVDTRTRLLEAAGPVFAAHGFDGATVREICSAAEVNVALVGYYFGDKLGLYREVIRGVRESRERRFPTPNNDAGDPRRTLYRIVRTLLSRMLACDESGWETQLLMREMHRPTPVFENMVGEFFRPQFDRLVETIGELTGTSVPKHRLEKLALSVVGQCLYYRIGAGIVQVLIPPPELKEHFDIDSLSRHITTVMLAATQGGTAIKQDEELEQWLSDH